MTQLPRPDWYDDPISPNSERWWDGEKWSEQTRPKAPPAPVPVIRRGELRDVGAFMSHSLGLVAERFSSIVALSVATGAVVAGLGVWLMYLLLDGGVDLVDDDFVGWHGTQTVQTVLIVGLMVIVATPASVGIVRLLWDAAEDKSRTWLAALRFGVINAPRFVGWMLAIWLPMAAVVGIFVAFAFNSGGGALGLVFLLAIVPVSFWNLIILLMPAIIVRAPRGTNPIASALKVVRRRWWRIFGRTALFGFIINISFNVVLGVFGAVLGGADVPSGFWPALITGVVIVVAIGTLFVFFFALQTAPTVSIAYDVMDLDDAAAPMAGIAS